jgi:hypothetical protein
MRGADKALRFSEHLEGDGEAIFRHACALGLEGNPLETAGCALPVRSQPNVAEDQEPELRAAVAAFLVQAASMKMLQPILIPTAQKLMEQA